VDLHKEGIQEALGKLERMYRDEVTGWAEHFRERVKNEPDLDVHNLLDAIDEELDGAECVIYTYQARLVGMLSDSYSDAIGELVEEMGISAPTPEQIAFICLRKDVLEDLGDIDALFEELRPEVEACES